MNVLIFILFLASTIVFGIEFVMTKALIALGLCLAAAAFTLEAFSALGIS